MMLDHPFLAYSKVSLGGTRINGTHIHRESYFKIPIQRNFHKLALARPLDEEEVDTRTLQEGTPLCQPRCPAQRHSPVDDKT